MTTGSHGAVPAGSPGAPGTAPEAGSPDTPGTPAGPWPDARAQTMLEALDPALLALMDELSSTMFCAKDVSGRYVAVNTVFVARTNEDSRAAVVGRRAAELFVPPLAERYEEQDSRVLSTGQPLRHELELIRPPGGAPGWYLTAKVPVRAGGHVIGLVSISEDLRATDLDDGAIQSLARVAALVQQRLTEQVSVEEMARAAGCSPATLTRRMQRVYSLSPGQFVVRARIDRAVQLLTGTQQPIARIASATGFYDQAAFTRAFARVTGETPAQFRRQGRGEGTPTNA